MQKGKRCFLSTVEIENKSNWGDVKTSVIFLFFLYFQGEQNDLGKWFSWPCLSSQPWENESQVFSIDNLVNLQGPTSQSVSGSLDSSFHFIDGEYGALPLWMTYLGSQKPTGRTIRVRLRLNRELSSALKSHSLTLNWWNGIDLQGCEENAFTRNSLEQLTETESLSTFCRGGGGGWFPYSCSNNPRQARG